MNPILSPAEIAALNNALYFMKVPELRAACSHLSLPSTGNKAELIDRIMRFVQMGEITQSPVIPPASCAKNHPPQPLHSNSLMLYGAYKNDLATRIFFKNLIGKHFHFTAYGIDWLTQRWLQGNPPTYQEFANYWTEETAKRKQAKAAPKKEWALINFMIETLKENPGISYDEVRRIWKDERRKQAEIVIKLLKKLSKKK